LFQSPKKKKKKLPTCSLCDSFLGPWSTARTTCTILFLIGKILPGKALRLERNLHIALYA
jgi:hypothetical protein